MGLLTSVLAKEIDPQSPPFEQEWPGRRSLALEVAAAVTGPTAILVGVTLLAGVSYEPEVIAFVVCLLLAVVAFPLMGHLTDVRRLRIDRERVEVVRPSRTERRYWAQTTAILARDDLKRVRLDQSGGRLDLDLRRLGVNERLAVMTALRAHAAGLAIRPWRDTGRRLRERALPMAASVAALVIVGTLGRDYVGFSMGMRCSGPSKYMHERFDVPDGPGCVVIGVSGAAKRAGLRQGDKIIEQDGHPITSGPQFNDRFFDEDNGWLAWPPRKMHFVVLRGGEPEPLRVTLTLGPGGGIDLPQDDPLFWFRKARARLGEEPEKGIAEYSRAIELAPDFDLAYLYRGDLHYDLEDVQAAWSDYQRALELNPSLPEANRSMAWLWSTGTADDLERASAFITRAIDLDGCEGGFEGYNLDCRYDYLVLADIREAQGDTVAAAAAREQAEVYYPK